MKKDLNLRLKVVSLSFSKDSCYTSQSTPPEGLIPQTLNKNTITDTFTGNLSVAPVSVALQFNITSL